MRVQTHRRQLCTVLTSRVLQRIPLQVAHVVLLEQLYRCGGRAGQRRGLVGGAGAQPGPSPCISHA